MIFFNPNKLVDCSYIEIASMDVITEHARERTINQVEKTLVTIRKKIASYPCLHELPFASFEHCSCQVK